jgi:hypothetical protein
MWAVRFMYYTIVLVIPYFLQPEFAVIGWFIAYRGKCFIDTIVIQKMIRMLLRNSLIVGLPDNLSKIFHKAGYH